MTHRASFPLLPFIFVAPLASYIELLPSNETPVNMDSLMGNKTRVWSPGTPAGGEGTVKF
jgi:hypothetical protein